MRMDDFDLSFSVRESFSDKDLRVQVNNSLGKGGKIVIIDNEDPEKKTTMEFGNSEMIEISRAFKNIVCRLDSLVSKRRYGHED